MAKNNKSVLSYQTAVRMTLHIIPISAYNYIHNKLERTEFSLTLSIVHQVLPYVRIHYLFRLTFKNILNCYYYFT